MRASVAGPDQSPLVQPGLRFSIDGAHRFSYQVERQGPALVLRAIGDQDCDQVRAVYEVTLTLDGGKLTETWKRENPLE